VELVSYILIVVLVVLAGAGAVYGYQSLRGPRKLEEIGNLIAGERYREALAECQRIIQQDDRSMIAHFLAGQCHQALSEYPMAVVEYKNCIRIGKFDDQVKEIPVRRGLARSLIESGNANEAKNEFLILTTLEPNQFENHFELGRLFHRGGIYPKSIKFLQTATALNVKNAEAFNVLGQSHYALKQYHDARAALIRAVQLKPDLKAAHYYLGLALRYLNDLDWALKEFEIAEKDDGLRDKALLAKGMVLLDQGNFSKAITELERGLKFAPPGSETMIQLYYLIGVAAEKGRDVHKAIASWEKIEQIKPGYRDVRDKLRQYQEFRTDDSVKDFLIMNTTQFENACRRIIEKMGFQVLHLMLNGEMSVTGVGTDADVKSRNRGQKTLFFISRDMAALPEKIVREFHESMREKGALRGVIMTTGEVMPAALNYATTRPIEIYDSSAVVPFIRTAMN
jgi:tetratricopeptide (TPR) repeat protein